MKTTNLKVSIFILAFFSLLSCKKDDTQSSKPSSPSEPASLPTAPVGIAEITQDFAFAPLWLSTIDQMMGMNYYNNSKYK